ncbi:MAG: polysaccharide biosynthesis tyrosine autokinase, partial [Tissierellia bacterium]|nr:polysaccharide biosynthesis tyrosine autokinase [Tissierellia bacterium]
KDMFDILKRRSIVILVILILTTAIGGAFSALLNQQEYSSTTSLLVGEEKEVRVDSEDPIDDDTEGEVEPVYETIVVYGNATVSKQATSLYNEIMQRKDLLEGVIDELGLDISTGQLRSSTTMEVPSDSGIIEITVKGIDLHNADEIANRMAKGFMELVFEITEVENMQVMNYGNKPRITNTQNIKLNTSISAMLGLMMGIFLAFIMEYLDDRLRTADDIENKLGLEVIGEVFDNSKAYEAFRTIRTNIQFSNKFKDKKVLVVATSASDEESIGLSLDLSKIMAEGNRKVLLVDSDLRAPKLHEKLGLSNEAGLSNVLLGTDDLDKVLNFGQENPNLHILTSGPMREDIIELLSGDKIKDLLMKAKDRYDYIILNSHPIHHITDSVALSALADGVILALTAGVTREGEAEAAKKALDRIEANIIGVLLNRA